MRYRRGIRHPTRRDFLAGAAATGAALGLGAPAVLAQSTAPFRIGVLNSFTGVADYAADANYDGMAVYFDEIGWKVAGRTVELIKGDDQFDPQVALGTVKRFVQSDHVDMIVGPQASNVALAIMGYVRQTGNFLVVSAATNDAITRQHIPTVFRTCYSTWQCSRPMGDWYYDHVGHEVVLCATDYSAGHEIVGEFRTMFERRGGKVLKEIYPPLGTTDFSVYLAEIRALAPPGIYAFFVGADSTRWIRQFAEFGLKDKVRLAGYGPFFDARSIAELGRTALGGLSPLIYTDRLDNPANQRFVAEYLAKTKGRPLTYSECGYTAARVIAETLKATGGDGDKSKLAAAMVKVAFDAPRGPFRFDPATHNPIQNVYICEVQEQGGELVNNVVDTIRDVQDPGRKDG